MALKDVQNLRVRRLEELQAELGSAGKGVHGLFGRGEARAVRRQKSRR